VKFTGKLFNVLSFEVSDVSKAGIFGLFAAVFLSNFALGTAVLFLGSNLLDQFVPALHVPGLDVGQSALTYLVVSFVLWIFKND
jgi:hypothetical protein